ncbi:MAG: phosphate signaling complex protein PhoU [Cellulosilyticaceae bacterium]
MSPRKVFENELKGLSQKVIHMGNSVEALIEDTIKAIVNQDKVLAREVIKKDDYIDKLQIEIEKECVLIITQQQPIARDLRFIMAILKIVTDLERIADHCEDICEYSLQIDDGNWNQEENYKRHIEKMALDVKSMLHKTINSFVTQDIEKIKQICNYDDLIDQYFSKIWKEIIEEMIEKKEFIPHGADYIMIIKYLERIADHTTNIAEWLIYNMTGEYRTEQNL